ncbi:CehA/McbA family metallohydrolase [Flexibacterium corallicola]|uniref:CehA/McbA family metallohydrolase n=1 Tax=Flexibacterium corallicola TaxID=3037259 RepID=UPI00286F2E59|nr:CehA/McbA family metallohydrolase [Pseudovibrio sp. M1P-2-3]
MKTEGTFEKEGRFYRGNLHTHSNRSDGTLTPEEVCRRYHAEGYDFIAVTDHFVGCYDYPIVDTRPFRREGFTTILGAELHSGAMENGSLWHILAVGLPEDFAPPNSPDFYPVPDQENGSDIAQRARDAGAFVVLAHPEWSGLTMNDARSLKAAHAVEAYNHDCFTGADRGFGFHTLEHLLDEGKKLTLCATDDAHFKGPDHFGGWVMVKASENSPEALLAALKAGHYYSSQGPELHSIRWNRDLVEVECSAVSSVLVQGRGIKATAIHGEAITKTSLPLEYFKSSDWLRITIVDRAGKRAWSNPIWRT